MSTGIGNHKFSTDNKSIWEPDLAICPYCQYEHCEADFCDVGVGLIQCGPYYCPVCKASEISSLDTRILSEKEKETGWFEPGKPVSDVANTVNGKLVNHKEAKEYYNIGLLDVKQNRSKT